MESKVFAARFYSFIICGILNTISDPLTPFRYARDVFPVATPEALEQLSKRSVYIKAMDLGE